MRLIIPLILLISFAFSPSSLGQEKAEAVLLDEIPRESCDPLLSRVDGFLHELKRDPAAKGFIVVYGEKDDHLNNLRYEQLLKDSVNVVRFDINRIEFVHGKNQEKLRIQFWKIPIGAESPSYEKGAWSYSLSKVKKPFIFYEESWGWDICPPRTDLKLYSKLLLENPNWRGHLVIYESSAKKFSQTRAKLLDELVEDNNVSRNRIRIFKGIQKHDISNVEYWLVPKKEN